LYFFVIPLFIFWGLDYSIIQTRRSKHPLAPSRRDRHRHDCSVVPNKWALLALFGVTFAVTRDTAPYNVLSAQALPYKSLP
jgi:hypothetical protein